MDFMDFLKTVRRTEPDRKDVKYLVRSFWLGVYSMDSLCSQTKWEETLPRLAEVSS